MGSKVNIYLVTTSEFYGAENYCVHHVCSTREIALSHVERIIDKDMVKYADHDRWHYPNLESGYAVCIEVYELNK